MRSIDLLDWDDLRVFLDVARTGNLSQTSRRLRIDHSTVSRRISQLEQALGSGVFERTRSGFKLNDLGKRLLPHAEAVESAMLKVRSEVNETAPEAAGTVRLATMEGIASLYLAPRAILLRDAAPHITLELVTSPQMIYVNRREADLFISFFKPPGQGLVSEKIGSFRLGLYASQSYLDRKGCPADLADLADHDFITYVEDLIQVDTVRWLDEVIQNPRVVMHSSSMIAQRNAAIGGLGIVLLPRFSIHETTPLVPILHDKAFTTREIWTSVHQDLQFSPRIRTVIAFLTRQIQSDMQAGIL
ncbi:LysR family transcriptional regulator [Pseudorhodoplanes sinuspersici]|uniref:LysR family transcriptional regulator n=3 Tax=Pseudorhodoplanes sinuspersici TaxID=1235591 RepID=A0A1W6ZZD0_9HYPH|nr:LysR family transcriptional regulator [Pseudorhodoplanes sinuspersici]RKE74507.1 LysR family transcriptional regulator [Pseudorhodoplanes sinuspersici]